MRVIAGEYRGRPLKPLKGDNTRPTTDRVKESLMSSLSSALGGFEGVRVLDAFAGSGQLGIEALSRGASHAVFCEQQGAAARVVQANLAACKVDRSRYRVLSTDTFKVERVAPCGPYDLVFLDPPYAIEASRVFAWIAAMDAAGAFGADCVLSYEFAKRDAAAVSTEVDALEWREVSSRTYGDTAIVILRKE
jgi:16S rRNA (guanine966-N2)-methyltransferase